MEHQLYIVDVFAEEKYGGNPLAVVMNAVDLTDALMRRISRELNYSETTFVLSDKERDDGYDVRIFTPQLELPFAGHPTLGTAYVIREAIVRKPVDRLKLNMKIGPVPVVFDRRGRDAEVIWMQQQRPSFGQILDPGRISEVLNLAGEEIDERFPVQEVSTGLPFIIVPLKSLDSVKKARIDRDKYFDLIKTMEAESILIYCPDTYHRENDLNVRVFSEAHGVPEDPATGSGNGCLAGYLVEHGYFNKDDINIRVEQGYEIGRPSLLLLRAAKRAGGMEIHVGGRVIMVARGELL